MKTITIRPYNSAARPHLHFSVRVPKAVLPLVGGAARRFFATEKQAQTFVKEAERRINGISESAKALGPKQAIDAAKALEILVKYPGETLEKAARFYKEQHIDLRVGGPKMIGLTTGYLLWLQANASEEHYQTAKSKVGNFLAAFRERVVKSITAQEIEDYLNQRYPNPVTRNSTRRYLHGMFAFACRPLDGFLKKNPVEDTTVAREPDKGDVGVLTVEQMTKLLSCAHESLIPYLTIGGFSGLRVAELKRLTFEDLDFQERIIDVKGRKGARSMRHRFVTMPNNLYLWLEPYSECVGSIIPTRLNGLLEEAKQQAGITEWPGNALRHSFASAHLRKFKDVGKTQEELGHAQGSRILEQNYRRRMTDEEACAWFNITPNTQP